MASPNSTGDQENLNDTSGTANNNSILGKVKSRVKGILPNTLSKWFSPSQQNATPNNSINGSYNESLPRDGHTRRRRFIEVDQDGNEEDEEEENDVILLDGDENDQEEQSEGSNDSDADTNEQDDSENSEEDGEGRPSLSPSGRGQAFVIRGRRAINPQEPKRRRVDLNVPMNPEDESLMVPRQPLIASTPAYGGVTRSRRPGESRSQFSRSDVSHFRHLNLKSSYQNEPGYDFSGYAERTAPSTASKIIFGLDRMHQEVLVPEPALNNNEYMSPRRVLNIPPSSGSSSSLHRAALSSTTYKDLPSTSANALSRKALNLNATKPSTLVAKETELPPQNLVNEEDEILATNNNNKYNGKSNNYMGAGGAGISGPTSSKRLRLVNGSGSDLVHEQNEGRMVNETASESSDGGRSSNIGKTNSQASSRTSLMNSGINFNAHLEGRKSLFATSQIANNSSLSLNSWNRKQFNPSIYGSNSALSDSRLMKNLSNSMRGGLNKSSTMYGGMNATMKFHNSGAGASFLNLTPTQMRPTSSLSSLTSSTNSLGLRTTAASANPHLSNATKGILDIMNNLSTPLSEAKKMGASFLKLSTPPRNRLNETDLHQSRIARLERVRTPYGKPLNRTERSCSKDGPAPPVRELTVPSKSHLMKIKKLQNSTEQLRQMALESGPNNFGNNYILPINDETDKRPPQQSKMKLKHNRVTNTKTLELEESPPPVNLPSIAFPAMTSIPKIDIELPKTKAPILSSSTQAAASNTSITSTSVTTKTKPFEAFATNKTSSSPSAAKPVGAPVVSESSSTPKISSFKPMFQFNKASASSTPDQKKLVPDKTDLSSPSGSKLSTSNGLKEKFKFSLPTVVRPDGPVDPSLAFHFKFSKPSDVLTVAVPKLKNASCLEVFKMSAKPSPSPSASSSSIATSEPKAKEDSFKSFGSEFKKQQNEWECDLCMVRNKENVSKCVACETPRKTSVPSPAPATSNNSLASSKATFGLTNNFGSQFKKPSGDWECDTCLIRNKPEAEKCVACETPKTKTSASSGASTAASLGIKQSFGDSFKPKANTWECPTCMINNKSDQNECVACNTKNPNGKNENVSSAAVPPKPAFSFGFPSASSAAKSSSSSSSATSQDAGFKKLAATQKSSTWECEACMTRNEAGRNKCICCEQAKPGSEPSETDSAPKFSFGATAAKYTFGFNNAASTSGISSSTTTTATTTTTLTSISNVSSSTNPQKTEDNSSNKTATSGFTFGTVSSTSGSTANNNAGFSFGFKPTASSEATASKENDSTTKKTEATESSKTSSSSATMTTNTSSPGFGGFKFGSTNTSTVSSSTTSAAPTMTSSLTTGGFSFGSKLPSMPSTQDSSKDAKSAKALAGFQFSSPKTEAEKPLPPPSSNAENKEASSSKDQAAEAKTFFGFGNTQGNSGGFSFKANNKDSSSSEPAKPPPSYFGSPSLQSSSAAAAAPSSSTTAAPTTTTSSSSSTPQNMFQFGKSSSTTTTTSSNLFGLNTSSAITSSSSAPAAAPLATFGSTNQNAATNIFGSFGGQNSTTSSATKAPEVSSGPATTAAPAPSLFGSTNTGTLTQTSNAPFAFGSSAPGNTANVSSSTTNNNGFVFGSSANAPSNNEANKPAIFGSFGSNNNKTTSENTSANIFGNVGTPKPTFGATTSLFGSSSAPSTAPTNLFGSPSSASGSMTQQNPPPAFGATPAFGSTSAPTPSFGSNSSTPAPSFGSSPAPTPTFGLGSGANNSTTPAFGSSTNTNTFGGNTAGIPTFGSFGAQNNTQDSAAPAKPEPFKFGDPGNAPTPNLFAFGASSNNNNNNNDASAAKRSFNFGSSNAAAQPTFSFGSNASAGGEANASSNSPFQFNAAGSAAPPSSNIFAPLPAGPQSAAQGTRRKIRTAVRRINPR